ncbi:hypothetical protein CTAYLR_004159 [Chrysophaeum taylorii]|uniref:Aminotransferase class I/classII large domain-containing protein n=1 Tax=Chrysophaeum taylorii TaxID=2483200 RepID=A0AAD7XT59_9STRA|nr:hypothetical protein CTAYLR_004159 [Chrysophaeum taylorii]
MVSRRDVAAIMGGGGGLLVVALLHWNKKKKNNNNNNKDLDKNKTRHSALSSRGERLMLPALPYMEGVMRAFFEPYHAEVAPDGFILLAVAENKLCWSDILMPRVDRYFKLENLPEWSSGYGPTQGSEDLRKAMALVMARRMYHELPAPCPFKFGAEDLVLAAGVGAALSNLFYAITEPGDVVLIPAPYYSAFDADLRAFADLVRFPVALDDNFCLTPDALEDAYRRAWRTHGRPPRALLVTNPHNPLGRIATVDELRGVVEWCDAKNADGNDLDLVSDEIYALSCFANEKALLHDAPPLGATKFVSLANVVNGDLATHRAHIVWGLSKDFGVSGFRVGALWSGDNDVKAATSTAAIFTAVSGLTQAITAEILGDHGWITAYVDENARRLAEACVLVEAILTKLGLPFVPPLAGMFIFADLSSLLPLLANGGPAEDLWDLEAKMYADLVDNHHLVLTPGSSQHAKTPGWFRICYAYVQPDVLKVGMDRLEAYVTGLRATAAAAGAE